MNIELSPLEARVIGCLIEKQITTPDQYPLSLNALVNACNQKSNRDPVMEVDERTVQDTLDQLARKHFVIERSEEHTSELQSLAYLVCRLLLEKKKTKAITSSNSAPPPST